MATAKKNGAVIVIRDRKTAAMPAAQLGAFPKLFEPDDYDPTKPKFKVRLHYNPAGIAALKTFLTVRCIEKHFAAMALEAAEQKLPIVADISGCQTADDWLEQKLKEPHEKSKIQLPQLEISVPADKPLKGGEKERREIKFWDAQNNLLDPSKLRRMATGTWVEPIVHPNLFLSKQLGKDPRAQLQLVGLRIIHLIEWGGQEVPPSAIEEEQLRAIMGAEFDVDDHLQAYAKGATVVEAPGGEEGDDDSPF